jgi:hypothetical protein
MPDGPCPDNTLIANQHGAQSVPCVRGLALFLSKESGPRGRNSERYTDAYFIDSTPHPVQARATICLRCSAADR